MAWSHRGCQRLKCHGIHATPATLFTSNDELYLEKLYPQIGRIGESSKCKKSPKEGGSSGHRRFNDTRFYWPLPLSIVGIKLERYSHLLLSKPKQAEQLLIRLIYL
jgi:hypothetical protein